MVFNDPTTTLEDLVEIVLQEYVERRKRLQILEFFDQIKYDEDYHYKQQRQSEWGVRTLKFTWDDAKNLSNQQKHNVDFDEAKTVFQDDYARLIFDPDHSETEDRFILLGLSARLRLLIVCHCYREGEVIRIISARRANKSEQRQYKGFRYER